MRLYCRWQLEGGRGAPLARGRARCPPVPAGGGSGPRSVRHGPGAAGEGAAARGLCTLLRLLLQRPETPRPFGVPGGMLRRSRAAPGRPFGGCPGAAAACRCAEPGAATSASSVATTRPGPAARPPRHRCYQRRAAAGGPGWGLRALPPRCGQPRGRGRLRGRQRAGPGRPRSPPLPVPGRGGGARPAPGAAGAEAGGEAPSAAPWRSEPAPAANMSDHGRLRAPQL